MKTPLFNKIFTEIFNKKTEISRKKELIDQLVIEDPQLINKNSGHDTFKYGNIVFNSILKEPEIFEYIKNKNYPIDYSAITGRNRGLTLLDGIILGERDELFTTENIELILKSLAENNKFMDTSTILGYTNHNFDIADIIKSFSFNPDILLLDTDKYDYALDQLFRKGHPEIETIVERLELDSDCINLYSSIILNNLHLHKNPEAMVELLEKNNINIQKIYDNIENKFSFLEDLNFEAGNVLKKKGIQLYLNLDTPEKILNNISPWFHAKKSINLYLNNKDFTDLNTNYNNIEAQDIFFLHLTKLNIKEYVYETDYKIDRMLQDINDFFSKCSPLFVSNNYGTYYQSLNLDELQPKYIFSVLNDIFLNIFIHVKDETRREKIKEKAKEIIVNYINNKEKNIFSDNEIYKMKNDAPLRHSIYTTSPKDLAFEKIDNAEALLIKNNYIVNFDLSEFGNLNDFFKDKENALIQYFSEDFDIKMNLFLARYIQKEFSRARDSFDNFYSDFVEIENSLTEITKKDISPSIQEVFASFVNESINIPSLYRDKETIFLKYSLRRNNTNEEPSVTKKKRI